MDQLVEIMADNMEQASGGVLSHEEATCISEGLLDRLGLRSSWSTSASPARTRSPIPR